MPYIESPSPESFFTPCSTAVAQAAGITAVRYNIDVINDLGAFMAAEADAGLPAPADQIDFVYTWDGEDWDTPWAEAGPDFVYIPGSQITQLSDDRISMTKAEVLRRRTTVMELKTNEYDQPLSGELALQLLALAAARHTQDANEPKKRPAHGIKALRSLLGAGANGHRLAAMARRDFAGAIILEREPARST